ncbi:MAG: PEP-CTERM sorting domain-containing protein [Chitinivibrionales bacterium]|nr:PEP-CTERM sorting domain-containing protein [Chitinivibrionales bacterium]
MKRKALAFLLIAAFLVSADPIPMVSYTGEVPGVMSESAELVVRYGGQGLGQYDWEIVFIKEGSVDWSTVRYFEWNTDATDAYDMDFTLTYDDASDILTFDADNLTDINGDPLSTSLAGVASFNGVGVSTIVKGTESDPSREITLSDLVLNSESLPDINSGDHVWTSDREFGGALYTDNPAFSSLDLSGKIDLDWTDEPGPEDMKVTMKFAKVTVPEPGTASLLFLGTLLLGAGAMRKRKYEK